MKLCHSGIELPQSCIYCYPNPYITFRVTQPIFDQTTPSNLVRVVIKRSCLLVYARPKAWIWSFGFNLFELFPGARPPDTTFTSWYHLYVPKIHGGFRSHRGTPNHPSHEIILELKPPYLGIPHLRTPFFKILNWWISSSKHHEISYPIMLYHHFCWFIYIGICC